MLTFTLGDLVAGFTLALLFVLMFRLQRAAWPEYYFAFGELIYGLRGSIAPLAFLLRTGFVFAFCLLSFAILRSGFPVYYGVSIGSFLIVWPAIVMPIQVEPLLYHRRKWLLLVYFLFVVFSIAIARIAQLVWSAVAPLLPVYVATWKDPTRIVMFLGDTLLALLLMPLVGAALWWILAWLKRDYQLEASQMNADMDLFLYSAVDKEEE
jgi:hypothetical protein